MYKREGRNNKNTRVIKFEEGVMFNAYASIAVSYGNTKIFCTI